jgi:SAM-dependent methyltransferase
MSDEINYSLIQLQREFDARKPIRDCVSQIVGRYVPVGGSIVELGSGLGHNLDALSHNYRVLGVEGLPDAAKKASERGIETIQADLERQTNLKAESWDAVLCLDVLEHLVDPIACIQEAWRLLRPSGVLIINVPNHFTLTFRIRILVGKGIDSPQFFPEHNAWNYPHLRFFQHQSIQKAVEIVGFSVVEDLTWMFPAVPYLHRFSKLKSMCLFLAKLSPNLFGGGFFLVLRKSEITHDT